NPPPVRRHLSVVAYEQSPVSILPSGALPVAGSPSSSREFRGRHTVSDDVDDLTDSFEGDAHLVPGFERGDLASQAPQLAEATAVSARARAEDIAGHDARTLGGVGDELGHPPPHGRHEVFPGQGTVDHGFAAQLEESVIVYERSQLIGGDDPRTESQSEILALARAEAHLHLP